MEDLSKKPDTSDPWVSLQKHTQARIAIGRAGVSVPSKASLDFKLDHAHARDAIYSSLNVEMLIPELESIQTPVYTLHTKAASRQEYLQRPDLGRTLSVESHAFLNANAPLIASKVAIIAADGLSAAAINDHFLPLLQLLLPAFRDAGITTAPVTLVEQGRVAVCDEIGSLLRADVALIFIGERPGLSSPNSMGLYLTYGPRPGLTDESRNCISNIRPEGLAYTTAVEKIFYLVQEALRRKLSGIALKDHARLLS